MSLLYEAEAKQIDPGALLEQLPIAPDPYAERLVRGVAQRADEVDALIAGAAVGWALDRMPMVDVALLRIAVLELVAIPETPTGAIVSEAVELAKAYSTDESGRFVNGVLGTIATQVRG